MLKLRLPFVFQSKAISHPYKFLVSNGISSHAANDLIKGQKTFIKMEHLEQLCRLLYCTPNDLLSWTPTKETVLPKDHPLNTLVRDETPVDLVNQIRRLPIDQAKQVEEYLKIITEKNRK